MKMPLIPSGLSTSDGLAQEILGPEMLHPQHPWGIQSDAPVLLRAKLAVSH